MKRKTPYNPENYTHFLNKCIDSIDAIINEIDSEIVNNFSEAVPLELRHDIVPTLKKLKDAKKEAELSLKLKIK